MSADYTLGFVQRDGNMHDDRSFGLDLIGALGLCMERREASNRHHIHWYIYDADDPEQGYFDP